MNRSSLALLAGAALALATPAFADHEEMHKKHEECMKKSGAFDQKTIDALGECHHSMEKSEKGETMEKGDHEAMKAQMDACLKEKGIALTDAQKDAMKGCHGHHKDKKPDDK